ncbi:hypothetical protein DDE82_000198 [Stemphylium lycopersici]|uniref:Uncharacterized protein n=1 Tax=Stemphylium lycopersici TaxID=183478 RepID=A0A364N5L4_STELY|nr:hypothetical protein TW65_09235 [Stemphylium lycopersici]RAR12487.1 hypothetical protein DDE82_000198 [Stemphylium lycopersici]RAR12628.1 hypothetical protein DDE83_004025 [Stemphylium lycopersici]
MAGLCGELPHQDRGVPDHTNHNLRNTVTQRAELAEAIFGNSPAFTVWSALSSRRRRREAQSCNSLGLLNVADRYMIIINLRSEPQAFRLS